MDTNLSINSDSIVYSPVWAALLAQHLIARGVDVAPLISAAGFQHGGKVEADTLVPFQSIARFFELAATAAHDPLLGFHFGQIVDSRDSGIIGFLGTYAETMRDGILNTSAFARVLGNASEFDTGGLNSCGRLVFYFHLPPSLPNSQYVEWFASSCISSYRRLLKRPIYCSRVVFTHPRRIGCEEMAEFFGCTIEYGGDENALYFRQADLCAEIPSSDKKLVNFLRSVAKVALERHMTNVPPLQESVERVLVRHMSAGDVSQNRIARELGMSSRTLSRRLAENGQTYRELLDSLREALATRYLTQSTLSQIEITFLLGFADQSSFASAYRRWTGQTPGAVRQKALHDQVTER
tara:strand:+ start:2887 stop:3942 length:1056 start_codon:yes stop_codon:yes gene_type:complete